MRRLLCVLLAAACVLTVGCTPTAQEPSAEPSESAPQATEPAVKVFALPYSREDTLNPYATATEANLSLAGLLYDSLTVIDGDFMPQPSLAAQITSTDATHLTVTLRQDAVFSDGSAVTPADVTASFEAARASANYDELLSNVASVAVDRHSGVLTFTLKAGDPNAAACLSFPVMKVSTVTKEIAEAPLGGGVYAYAVGDNGAYLVANTHRATKPRYTTVPLRHLPNAQSMYYGLASGNITYYYNDLNTGDIPRITGASGKVNMNALVYLGINSGHAALSQPAVRQALGSLIDREVLADKALAGWALPAQTPVHPVWGAAKELPSVFDEPDLAGALELLKDRPKMKLELIYSLDSGNRGALADMVRTQLESAGIQVTVTPLSYAEYMTRLQNGQFDLYIGEIRLTANMDLDPLLGGGTARYGIAGDNPAVLSYRQYRAGEITLAQFFAAFGEGVPYVPLCWRCGFAGYDRRLLTVTPHGFSPYYGLADWQ